MAVRTFVWKKTRSPTTASGRISSTSALSSLKSVCRRSGKGVAGLVVTTPPALAVSRLPRRWTRP
jgi:hypothetical protein